MTKSKESLDPSASVDRRKFLVRAGAGTAAAIAAGTVGIPALEGTALAKGESAEIVETVGGNSVSKKRAGQAYQLRVDSAKAEKKIAIPDHLDNGDEALYPTKINSYSKGLKHDPITGEVVPATYDAYLSAIQSGSHEAIEALVDAGHFGTSDPLRQRRLVNPLSGLAFDMQGTDSHQLAIPPAPAFTSAQIAGEMAELYWMALLRDVPFNEYETNPIAQAACDDLSRMSDFRGPKVGGQVTPQTLFRDTFPGCTTGPYVSQFLLRPAGFGAQEVDQRVATAVANLDYVTTFDEWLDVQNGVNPSISNTIGDKIFTHTGRNLGMYVHIDVLYQAYFVAFLVMMNDHYPFDAANPYGPTPDGGAGRPLPANTPGSRAQVGFGTFGGPFAATLVTEPATRALKAQWYQKWFVHRRARPEEFGGRVEAARLGRASYPFHSDLTSSPALDAVFGKFGSHLLPMAFPEGSPLHTSYGSGHATVAGASITMLKALFDESAQIVNPVTTSADGSSIVPYEGEPLTVGGELNKIGSNVAQGRNIAGVHWRSDAVESLKLGEAVAISILRDSKGCYSESFNGFSLTKFDGTTITI